MGQFLGSLGHDPDGGPDVGLAAHLRAARADGRRDRRRRSRRAAERSAERPGCSSRPGSSGGRRGPATGASTSAPRPRRSIRCSPAPAPCYRRMREIAERGLAAMADRSPAASARLRGVPRRRWRSSSRSVPARSSGERLPARPRRRRPTEPKPADAGRGGPSMTAIIQTEKLTKTYGEHRGIIDVDLDVDRGRGVRLPRPQRRRQDDDDPDPARPDPADQRAGLRLRDRDDGRPGRDPPPGRLPARRVRAVRPADRRPDDRLLRQPARRRRRGIPGRPDPPPRHRHEPQVQGVLEGQQAEDRAGRRAPAPAGPADPRRADIRVSTRSSSRRSSR